jgi:NAD(P)-dependent dehydrogenase (short-subunit alcohol dehydrogenase family)
MMVEINLLGLIFGCRAAVEAMRSDPDGAHLINMASMSSFGPVPGLAVYGATKHGVLGFTESLAGDLRLAEIPITMHAVCPDLVNTDMMRAHADNPEYALGFSGGKIYTPDEIADEIVKLVESDRIILAIPRSRMWLARTAHLFPRAGLPVAKAIRAAGERRRQKYARAG